MEAKEKTCSKCGKQFRTDELDSVPVTPDCRDTCKICTMQKMMSELLDFGSDMRFMEEELDQFGAELDALCLGKEAPAKKPIENEKEDDQSWPKEITDENPEEEKMGEKNPFDERIQRIKEKQKEYKEKEMLLQETMQPNNEEANEEEEESSSFADFMVFTAEPGSGSKKINGSGFQTKDWSENIRALYQVVLFFGTIGFKAEHTWKNKKEFDSFSNPPRVVFKGASHGINSEPKTEKDLESLNAMFFAFLEGTTELFGCYKKRIKNKEFLKNHEQLPFEVDSKAGNIDGIALNAKLKDWRSGMGYLLKNLEFLMEMEKQRCEETGEAF